MNSFLRPSSTFLSPLRIACTCACAALASTVLQAQIWTNPGTGDWFTPANWSSGATPGSADHARLSTGTATLSSQTAAIDTLTVGLDAGATTGNLRLVGGGVLTSDTGFLGYRAGATGIMTVDGAGSQWNAGRSLDVGLYGTGTLNIANQGKVSSAYGTIGTYAGSAGTVNVSGAGSNWTTTDYTHIGSAGQGTLALTAGATVNTGITTLGRTAGSTGTATIDGAGSHWTTSRLLVGYDGTGSVTVTNGGALTSTGSTDLGSRLTGGPESTVSLSGGSSWTNGGLLSVGYFSDGRVTLSDGSQLTGDTASIGDGQSSVKGYVTLSDASSWTNTGNLTVGERGTGTLTISGGSTVSNAAGVIAGQAGSKGTVTVSGAGSRWTNGTSLHVGRLGLGTLDIHGGGTVSVGGAGTVTLGTTSATSGIVSEIRLGQGAGAGTLDAALVTAPVAGKITFNHTDAAHVFSPALAGKITLLKLGSGTTTLSGANTITGTTTIRGGTLATGSAGALSATSVIFLNDGATLDLAGHNQTVGDLDSYDVATGVNDTGTVKLGGATLTNQNRVTNNWAGSITGEGTFVKKGSAEMNWYAANTFAGTLQIDAGTLIARNAGVLSPHAVASVASAGTLALNNYAQTAASLAGAGRVTLGTATLTVAQAGDSTFSGVISGSGALVKSGAGTLDLSGSNTFSGGLTITEGTVRVTSNQALGQSSGKITVQGGTLALANAFDSNRTISLTGTATIATTQTNTLSGVLSGSGSLTKSGSGSLTLSGANTYTGGTTIAAGTVRIANATGSAFGTGTVTIAADGTLTGAGSFSGALQNDGTYAPGSSPTLASLSSFSQGATGTLLMEIAGLARGSGYDALDIAGTAALGGTLSVSFIDGFSANSLSAGSSFNLFDWDSVSGSFDSLLLPDLSGTGLVWNTSALYSDGLLSVSASAIPEPSTYAALAGLAALALVTLRRRRSRPAA